MMALLLTCTMALDSGASATLVVAKAGTAGAIDGVASGRAADVACSTDGARYEGTATPVIATDGTATSDLAAGRTAWFATDGIALGGAVDAGVPTAGAAAVGPEVGD